MPAAATTLNRMDDPPTSPVPGSPQPSSDETPAQLGSLQAAILEDLWSAGESPIREVVARLEGRGLRLAYTTVLTVMVRLHARGLLARRRDGRRDLYRAAVGRGELSSTLTREAVERLVEAHGDAAVAAFVDHMRESDPAALARLRDLLDAGEL